MADNLRAGSIIQSLRSIFNSDAAQVHPFELNAIIQAVLQITGQGLSKNNIKVTLKLAPNTLVQISAPEIQQVVLNLINNAAQALSRLESGSREILIETRCTANTVTLTIADNGLGIRPEQKLNLFELNAQKKSNGMGLGLWLCKLIVTRNAGTIEYSDAPTGGAVFTITLPSAAIIEPSITPSTSVDAPPC